MFQQSKNILLKGLLESLQENEYNLVIGDILAIQLGLTVGDSVNILVPETSLGLAGIFPVNKEISDYRNF